MIKVVTLISFAFVNFKTHTNENSLTTSNEKNAALSGHYDIKLSERPRDCDRVLAFKRSIPHWSQSQLCGNH
jgi:hypothetical protein